MSDLSRGGNAPLTKELPQATLLTVGVSWRARSSGQEADIALGALALDASGRVLSGEDLVFAGQLRAATAPLLLEEDKRQFDLHLPSVPPTVQGVAFVAWSNSGGTALSTLTSLRARVLVEGKQVVATEELAPHLTEETAAHLITLYRHREEWKVRCKGEGWRDGLPALLAAFGVEP